MTAGRMLVALAAAGAVACATGPGPPTGSPAPPDFVLPSPAAGVPGHVLLISVAGLGPDAALAKGRDATKCRAFHTDWMSKWTAEQAAPRGGLAAARAACYRAPGAFSFG